MLKGIGIVPNWEKTNAPEVVRLMRSFFEGHKIPVYVVPESLPLFKLPSPVPEFKPWPQNVELVIVVGGDGTFLRVARELAFTGLPLLGINLGHKGFLAEIEVEELNTYLNKILEKDYSFGERIMLKTEVYRGDEPAFSSISLNDAIISRGPFSRIINLETYINNDFLESYPGDGLIISTPTGSTGYALSAGGPVVNPALSIIIVTPICPHLLYTRSVIVDGGDMITTVVATSSADVFLTMDGQEGFPLHYQDKVIVRKASCATRIITFQKNNFYKLLHDKLLDA